MRHLLIPALAAAASPLAAAPYSVALDAARCAPLAAGRIAELGPAWSAVAPYVQRCPVRGPNRRVALSVDIVRLDHAHAAGFFAGRSTADVPLPTLRDAAGAELGALPEGFPVDPPGELRVRFADWRGGLPRTIRLHQAGESALAPHALPPLRWDAKARRYR